MLIYFHERSRVSSAPSLGGVGVGVGVDGSGGRAARWRMQGISINTREAPTSGQVWLAWRGRRALGRWVVDGWVNISRSM